MFEVRIHSRTLAFTLAFCLTGLGLAQSTGSDLIVNTQLKEAQDALKARKYEDAIKVLKKAIKLQPSCAECHFSLALAYYRTRQVDEGLKVCDRAIAAAGNNALRAAGHNLKGNLLFIDAADQKRLAAAENEYRTAAQLDPRQPVYQLNWGRTLLRLSRDDEGKRVLEACLALNPDPLTSNQVRLMLADPRRARLEFAPEFELQTMQGDQFSLQQLKGKILVMDFWATWCPPCRASVPELKDLTRKYPASKLVLISVSADDDEQAWREFIAKKNMAWPQYRDADHKIIDAFGVRAYPTYLVIDGEGIVRQRITGMNPQESVVHRLKDTLQQMPQLEGELRK